MLGVLGNEVCRGAVFYKVSYLQFLKEFYSQAVFFTKVHPVSCQEIEFGNQFRGFYRTTLQRDDE